MFVLKSFPFHRYRIKVMTVERPQDELRQLLQMQGFQLIIPKMSHFGETLWIHRDYAKDMDLSVAEKFVKLK